ncbi:hypothetical protein [Pararhodobacter sp.]|uniref:hypothetical protein n=1 Tax=Pararhodobacter sp. TaxID=2127056 RepID=UPI002FE09D88
MEYIWIARVLDGSDFNRVKHEKAFADKDRAWQWAEDRRHAEIEQEEPLFKSGWYASVTSVAWGE